MQKWEKICMKNFLVIRYLYDFLMSAFYNLDIHLILLQASKLSTMNFVKLL